MYHKNLHNKQYTSLPQSHVYPDILSVVFIYCIVDPELQNTDKYYYADKESDNIEKKTVSSIQS